MPCYANKMGKNIKKDYIIFIEYGAGTQGAVWKEKDELDCVGIQVHDDQMSIGLPW